MIRGREQGASEKILLVDDAALSRRLLAEILKRDGYDVYEAEDGSSALAITQAIEPDLILLDIWMPDMDGHAVCQQLKTQPETWSIPIIFVTASAQTCDRSQALQSGGIDYITKPFAIPKIRGCVRRHLQHSTALHQAQEATTSVCQPKLPVKWTLRAQTSSWQTLYS